MSEMMSELRYLKLWGAGKMVAGPFDEQELMSWAAGEIERLTTLLNAEMEATHRLAASELELTASSKEGWRYAKELEAERKRLTAENERYRKMLKIERNLVDQVESLEEDNAALLTLVIQYETLLEIEGVLTFPDGKTDKNTDLSSVGAIV